MTEVFHRFCYTLEIDTGIVLNITKTTSLFVFSGSLFSIILQFNAVWYKGDVSSLSKP
jgi:hypothetical protein